jgi:hypothetical protein
MGKKSKSRRRIDRIHRLAQLDVRADRIGGVYIFEELGPAWGIWYSRDHLRRLCKEGKFPEPIPTSFRKDGTSNRIAWRHEDLAHHRDELATKRGDVAPRLPGAPDGDDDTRAGAAQ